MEAHWRIKAHFPDIKDDKLSLLRLFHVELLRYNEKSNLLAAGTEANTDLMHFYDSLKACEYIRGDCHVQTVYDIASGNGFPGLVYACMYSEAEIILVEPDGRKSEFLRHMVQKLQLKNTKVLGGKIEDLRVNEEATAIARDYTNLARSLLLGNKIFPIKTRFYTMKGTTWFSEVASLPSQICSTWNTEMALEYEIPQGFGQKVVLRSIRIS